MPLFSGKAQRFFVRVIGRRDSSQKIQLRREGYTTLHVTGGHTTNGQAVSEVFEVKVAPEAVEHILVPQTA